MQLMLYAVFPRWSWRHGGIRWPAMRALAAAPLLPVACRWCALSRWAIRTADAGAGAPTDFTSRALPLPATGGHVRSWRKGRAPSTGTLDGLTSEAVVGAGWHGRWALPRWQRLTAQPASANGHARHRAHDRAVHRGGRAGATSTLGGPHDARSCQQATAGHPPGLGLAPDAGVRIEAQPGARQFDLQPQRVTAALVGWKRTAPLMFVVQHFGWRSAEARARCWPSSARRRGAETSCGTVMLGVGERAAADVRSLVAVVSLASLVAVVLAGLNRRRRRELAVLRCPWAPVAMRRAGAC